MLNAAVASSPTKVTCYIKGTSYSTSLTSTGKKNDKNEMIYTGSLWNNAFTSKWGNKKPEEVIFVFTATYTGGNEKTHEVSIIVDNLDPYWKLHRVY